MLLAKLFILSGYTDTSECVSMKTEWCSNRMYHQGLTTQTNQPNHKSLGYFNEKDHLNAVLNVIAMILDNCDAVITK